MTACHGVPPMNPAMPAVHLSALSINFSQTVWTVLSKTHQVGSYGADIIFRLKLKQVLMNIEFLL